jgi:hypothetical protein
MKYNAAAWNNPAKIFLISKVALNPLDIISSRKQGRGYQVRPVKYPNLMAFQ